MTLHPSGDRGWLQGADHDGSVERWAAAGHFPLNGFWALWSSNNHLPYADGEKTTLQRPEAFDALFDRLYPDAVRLAGRLVGSADAEDVAVGKQRVNPRGSQEGFHPAEIPRNIEQQRVNDERQRTQRRRSDCACAGRWLS